MCGVPASVVVRGRCLQDFCKRQNGRNGVCRNAANATEIRLAFAGTLQAPRRYGWPSQERCKLHGNTVGLCRNAANATEIWLAFAGTLQTPWETGHMIGYLLLEVSFAGAIKIKDENHII